MELIPILKGAATYVPFLYRAERGATGGTVSARYCYAVWLRHLKLLRDSGLRTRFATVAELGPGDSLGIGLAALLCGATRLYALDVVRYADNERNSAILRELAELFRARAAIPDHVEFPDMRPRLEDYSFPRDMLPDSLLDATLQPQRVDSIARALAGEASQIEISYKVPWGEINPADAGSVDLVLSQAVLEHVEDLDWTYRLLTRWLAPQGVMSHVIDFRSHRLTRHWDGHLAYSPAVWRIVKGRRPYLLNRQPAARHLELLRECSFRVTRADRDLAPSYLSVDQLSAPFRSWSDEDRRTAGVLIQAVRN
jgi:hypothetical protein